MPFVCGYSANDRHSCGVFCRRDGGQHWLRPLREFMGEVVEVMAVTARPFEVIEGESLCHSLLRFESGKVASFQATVLSKHARMAHRADPFFRLIGQKGDLVISGTGLHGEPSVLLFTNERPEGEEMYTGAEAEQSTGLMVRPGPRGHKASNRQEHNRTSGVYKHLLAET